MALLATGFCVHLFLFYFFFTLNSAVPGIYILTRFNNGFTYTSLKTIAAVTISRSVDMLKICCASSIIIATSYTIAS